MTRMGSSSWLLVAAVCFLGMATMTASAMPQGAMNNGKGNAQDPANTPIKQGYVVVTPTSAATAGLVAFETFGERRGSEVEQAGVLPSTMTTHAAMFVNSSGRLSRNVGVAIANPAATPANVVLVLKDETGKTIASATVGLPAHQQTARFVTQLFASQASVPSDFTGILDISSDIPVAVVGLRFRGLNFSTIPATILGPVSAVPVISTGVGGAASVILAHFATGGGWASEIVLANFGATALTVRVDLFAGDGTPLSATLNGQTNSTFQNITIPPGGVAILAPLDVDGDSDF